jgi:hypothetical protein
MDYIACRLLQVEQVYDNNAEEMFDKLLKEPFFDIPGSFEKIIMSCMNEEKTELLPTNRFQLAAKASSYFVVEEMCRALDFKLSGSETKRRRTCFLVTKIVRAFCTCLLRWRGEPKKESARNVLSSSLRSSSTGGRSLNSKSVTSASCSGKYASLWYFV